MSKYYNEIMSAKAKILAYTKKIFQLYDNELMLLLEDYNLLHNKNNCIETSTVVGYVIEEFLVSKLENFTKDEDYLIYKNNVPAQRLSYDCLCELKNNILCLINIKVSKMSEKSGGNNAVAAIKQLQEDYTKNENQEKCFMVLKVYYNFDNSQKDSERKIFIRKIENFLLEEIDFSAEHRQDHRTWSNKGDENSGRLNISPAFLQTHKLAKEKISYQTTKKFILGFNVDN